MAPYRLIWSLYGRFNIGGVVHMDALCHDSYLPAVNMAVFHESRVLVLPFSNEFLAIHEFLVASKGVRLYSV